MGNGKVIFQQKYSMKTPHPADRNCELKQTPLYDVISGSDDGYLVHKM